MRYVSIFYAASLALLVSACGGGGGSPGAVTGGGGSAARTPTLAVGVVDETNKVVQNIAVGGAFSAVAIVRDAGGAPVAGRIVSFSVEGAPLAALNPDTALTDASGMARVAVVPTSAAAIGAATIVASATVNAAAVTGRSDFAVSSANLNLSPIAIGDTSLPSGGNSGLSVTALLGTQPASGIPVNVNFSTSCGRINGGTSSASVTTNGSGVASAVYTAVGENGSLCSGPVNLTASTAGATPRTTVVTVAPPNANAITFGSATPAQIFLAGSGAQDQSVVRFRVLAGSTPLPNVPVRFSLEVNPGGVGLGATGSSAPVERTTDAQGEASISVFSGTLPGPVRVRAALTSNPTIFSESQNLTVASGAPSQKFMSLAVQTFNIEGWNLDGASTVLTVRVADRQGNAVEDGTVINFTAEGGQVAPSCATRRAAGISSCSVDFVTQNPRPLGGRATVLAFTNGTKDYVDVNGNNRYDAGVDTLLNQGDAYRDDDENAQFGGGEFVVERGGTVGCAATGGMYPSRADTCDTSLATTVRQQAVILFSSSNPVLLDPMVSRGAVSFNLASIHNQLLPMPAGTTVTAVAAGGDCSVKAVSPSIVPNVRSGFDPSQDLTTEHEVSLEKCAAGDSVTVTITSPAGLATPFRFNLP